MLPLQNWHERGVFVPSMNTVRERRLSVGLPEVDDLLEGGLPMGSVVEMGMPRGNGGRELLTHLFARATQETRQEVQPLRCLWIRARQDGVVVYPPAWEARGVRMNLVRFAVTDAPLTDLKPLFLSAMFPVIVIDSPSQFLGPDDFAFLAANARARGQLVIVTRYYRLAPERGNVWAKLRLNLWRDAFHGDLFRMQVIRGLSPRQLSFSLSPRLASTG